MKFLCDANIPIKLSKYLENLGFESQHISRILNGVKSTDENIATYCKINDIILITKDSDFKDSFLVKGSPEKLIKVNLGNIKNEELIEKFDKIILNKYLFEYFDSFLIEIGKNSITIKTK